LTSWRISFPPISSHFLPFSSSYFVCWRGGCQAKTAKATGKLNDVLVEYDRFFEQYAMTAQGFYDDAEREEKARYSSIVKASTMVARGMGSLAEHADGSPCLGLDRLACIPAAPDPLSTGPPPPTR